MTPDEMETELLEDRENFELDPNRRLNGMRVSPYTDNELQYQDTKKRADLEFLSVGGTNLEKLGIKTIYDQKEITYIAFTDIIFNFFKIKRIIKDTVNELLKFKPDILFLHDCQFLSITQIVKYKKENKNVKIYIDSHTDFINSGKNCRKNYYFY